MNNAIISKIAIYLHQESWLIQVFIVVFITLLIDFIQKRVVDRVYRQFQETNSYWDDALVDAIRTPLRVVIWVIGISYAISIVQAGKAATIFAAVGPLRDVGVIGGIAWFLMRFITRCEASYLKHKRGAGEEIDQTTAHAIAQLLRLSVIITAALVGLQTLGYKVSGVLAFGGIGGIAVGFAAKDLLANIFGGMIHLDRPFSVGDWVRSRDRNIEGAVEKIGWRLTVMRTFDNRPLYVPNALFTQIVVENPSRMTNRRIVETVGIRYDDAGQMAGVVADVKAMSEAHPEIDTDQTLIVNFNEFSSSSRDFFVYTYTKTTNWVRFHEIKQDVLWKIIEIIEEHGAKYAFPTSTIHLSGPDGPETSMSAA